MSGHSACPETAGTGVGPAGVWNPLFLPDLSLFPPKGSRVRLRGVCVRVGTRLGWPRVGRGVCRARGQAVGRGPCVPPDLLGGPRTPASAVLVRPPRSVARSRQATSGCRGDSSGTCLALLHAGNRPGHLQYQQPVCAELGGDFAPRGHLQCLRTFFSIRTRLGAPLACRYC